MMQFWQSSCSRHVCCTQWLLHINSNRTLVIINQTQVLQPHHQTRGEGFLRCNLPLSYSQRGVNNFFMETKHLVEVTDKRKKKKFKPWLQSVMGCKLWSPVCSSSLSLQRVRQRAHYLLALTGSTAHVLWGLELSDERTVVPWTTGWELPYK